VYGISCIRPRKAVLLNGHQSAIATRTLNLDSTRFHHTPSHGHSGKCQSSEPPKENEAPTELTNAGDAELERDTVNSSGIGELFVEAEDSLRPTVVDGGQASPPCRAAAAAARVDDSRSSPRRSTSRWWR